MAKLQVNLLDALLRSISNDTTQGQFKMKPVDALGMGPTREALFNNDTQMWDITVTPPPWSGFSPSTVSITREQFLAYRLWLDTGVLIQNALPDLTDDEREILISGIKSAEFEQL